VAFGNLKARSGKLLDECLVKWIDESYRLVAPKKLVESLPESSPRTRDKKQSPKTTAASTTSKKKAKRPRGAI